METAQIPDADRYFQKFGLSLGAARESEARRHRHASAAHESWHRDRVRRRRRSAIGDSRPGAQRRRRAHGGARGGDRGAPVMSALPHEEAGRSHGVHPAHRGSIFLEDGKVIAQETWPGEQFVLRVSAPKCAARALPGSFVHLTCDPDVPMRRPLSIQRVDAQRGLDRDPLQDRRSRVAGAQPAACRRRHQRAGPDRPAISRPIRRGRAPCW